MKCFKNNPIISKIKQGITNKILSELKTISEKDKEKYLTFWKNFGVVLKEGLYEHNEFHEKLLPLLRFKSSINDDWIALDLYIDKIDEDQKEIYYFSNTEIDNKDMIKSPQLEAFIDQKIPVLFMTDAVDDFWLPNIGKYKNKEFKSITKGKIDLKKKSTDKDNNIANNTKEINDFN